MITKFKAGQITNDFEVVFLELIDILKNKNLDDLVIKLKEEIESSKQREKIKIVFVGQFSSGKSSIISALTGNKAIKIGSDVTTDSSENYEWGSFLLTDTPGLQNNETHDEIAENSIKNSDLIIYCITSELFNKNTLTDFKNLSFVKSYKNKMVLLINKINSEYTTDIEGLLNTYENQIEKDLKPYDSDSIPHCFIDVKDYLDGLKYDDKELINESRFVSFIDFLNIFLSEKGLMCKLTTPVLLAKQIIDEAFIDTSDTEEEKTKKIALSRLRRLVDKHRTKASKDWDYIVSEEIFSFCHQGFEIINCLGDESIDLELRITELVENTNKKLADRLQEFIFECDTNLRDELDEVLQSKVGQYLLSETNTKNLSINEYDGKKNNNEMLNQAFNSTGKLANELMTKIKPEHLYNVVEKIGHKVLKIKFKPWGITKTAGKLSKGLKALGPVMEFVGLAMDIKSTYDESKEAKEFVLAKKELRKDIKDIGDDIRTGFDEQKTSFLSELYEPVLAEIDRMNQVLIDLATDSTGFNNKLEGIKNKLDCIMDAILQ